MTDYQQQESVIEDFVDVKTTSKTTPSEEEEPQETMAKRIVKKTRSQEAVTALLASFGSVVEKCSEEFAKQDLRFRDLSVLSKKDLELLGITSKDKQEEIMETFRMLPNQREHFDK